MTSTTTNLSTPEYPGPGPGIGITDTCGLCHQPFDLMYPPAQYPSVTADGETPELICGDCQDFIDADETAPASPYAADPANPTDDELAAAIQRSLAAGILIDAADWMARNTQYAQYA